MKTSDHDDIFINILPGLDDDLQGRLLEEWLTQIPSPLQEPLDKKRVRSRVFDAIGLQKEGKRHEGRGHWRRRRSLWAIGAAGAAIVFIVGTPNPVSAALGKMLHFIPGIGQVQQTENGTVVVLPHAIRGTWKGAPVQVTGMMITSTELLVELSGGGTNVPGRVWFKTSTGRTISLRTGTALAAQSSKTAQWTGDYNATGGFGALLKDPSGTVIIGQRPGDHIPVQLRPATSAREMSNLGPTQVHHGVSLTAIASQNGTEAFLTFVAQYHGPFVIMNTVPMLPTSTQPDLQISDATGRHYTPTQLFRFAPNNQFTFKPASGVADYQVVVPQVAAMYTGQASVTLPVPVQSSERIDKTVTLGGFPIEITTVRRTHSKGGSLRMYLKLAKNSARQLYAFQLNESWVSQSNPKTGVVRWMQVGVRSDQHSITLQLSNPQVYIRGPWIFPIRIQQHLQ